MKKGLPRKITKDNKETNIYNGEKTKININEIRKSKTLFSFWQDKEHIKIN